MKSNYELLRCNFLIITFLLTFDFLSNKNVLKAWILFIQSTFIKLNRILSLNKIKKYAFLGSTACAPQENSIECLFANDSNPT